MLPQAQDKEKLSKQAYADQLMGLLSGYKPKDGYDPNAISQLVELGRYDPTAASIYAKNIATGGDEYRNKNVIEGQERQFEYGQKAADNQLGRAKDLGQFNSDLKSAEIQRAMQQKIANVKAAFPNATEDEVLKYVLGGGSGVSAINGANAQKINAAKASLADEQNWNKAHNDGLGNITEPYPYQEQANAARTFLQNFYGQQGGVQVGLGQGGSNVAMQGFVDKYNGLRKDDLSNINKTLADDRELISYLKNNPQMIAVFEAQTGIQLPRKK